MAVTNQLTIAAREVPNADLLTASAIYYEAPGGTSASTGYLVGQACQGTTCNFELSVGEETFQTSVMLEPLFGLVIAAESAGRLDPVLTNADGITLLRRRPGNATEHTHYGAWMENAGFIVAVDGAFVLPREEGGAITIPGRAAAAGGECEPGLPTADAAWKGLMVGTFQSGDEADDILQGQAELTFSSNRIEAVFSGIRNIDNPRAEDNRIADISFQGVETTHSGTYGTVLSDSRIAGAFYGDGRTETAGTFEKDNIVGAFGAKRVQMTMNGGG